MSGLIADARTLVEHARVETQNHIFSHGEPRTVESTTQALCDLALRFGEGDEESMEKQKARIREKLDKCVKDSLLDLCDLLDISISKTNARKEDLIVKLLDFMVAPHATTDVLLAEQLDGNSHVIYVEEEAAGTRLLIDGRTCFYYSTLQNDHDPSKLVAETPCKLLRFLVQDGSHVDTDTPYADVEVVKMCMPLLLPASGVVHFVMSEGQAMQAGDLIARLDLDDLSAVRKADHSLGLFQN